MTQTSFKEDQPFTQLLRWAAPSRTLCNCKESYEDLCRTIACSAACIVAKHDIAAKMVKHMIRYPI